MPRIRTVKPELFKHEVLFAAEIETGLPLRLAFINLFCVCDRDGRFEWSPKRLKLDLLPYDDLELGRVLDALEAAGLISSYEVEGRKFGVIPTWAEHQRPNHRELPSKIPQSPSQREYGIGNMEYEASSRGDDPVMTPSSPRHDPVITPSSPRQSPAKSDIYDDDFLNGDSDVKKIETIYGNLKPQDDSISQGCTIVRKMLRTQTETPERLIRAVENYSAYQQSKSDFDPQFVKSMRNFFGDETYKTYADENYVVPPSQTKPGGGIDHFSLASNAVGRFGAREAPKHVNKATLEALRQAGIGLGDIGRANDFELGRLKKRYLEAQSNGQIKPLAPNLMAGAAR